MPTEGPTASPLRAQGSRLAGLLWPFLLAAAVYLLWDSPAVFPLKIFTVFLHELSHGLAAVATGGAIERIELTADQGGVCWTRGGSRFLITSAGYLGSLLFGALLLVVGGRARPALQRAVVALAGAVVLGATFLWIRTGFGVAWGLLAAGTLLGTAVWLPAGASVFALRLLGITSGLYAIWDIGSDLIVRSVPSSDAGALASLTGVPGIVWGLLWGAAAVVVMARAVRSAVRTS
jgi:hypothetical protein